MPFKAKNSNLSPSLTSRKKYGSTFLYPMRQFILHYAELYIFNALNVCLVETTALIDTKNNL